MKHKKRGRMPGSIRKYIKIIPIFQTINKIVIIYIFNELNASIFHHKMFVIGFHLIFRKRWVKIFYIYGIIGIFMQTGLQLY